MTHEQAHDEARRRWPYSGGLTAFGQATEGWAEEENGVFRVGLRTFRGTNVDPEFETKGYGPSYEAAFEMVDLEELMRSPGRLRFLSHDARDVIDRSRRQDDLTLYFQAQLITLCCNYGAERVLGVLRPAKVTAEEAGETGTWAEVPGKKKRKSVSREMRFANDETLTQVFQKGLPKWLKDPVRNVTLSPRAVRNLYYIDQHLLGADWTVRVEVMASLLDRISDRTLEELVAECSYPRMSGILADIEAYLGGVQKTAEELAAAPEATVLQGTPVTPEGLKAFDDALKEFRESQGEEEKE